MRGGTPSTMQPIAGPWLSPQVVNRKRWPKPLADMTYRPSQRRGSPPRHLSGVETGLSHMKGWQFFVVIPEAGLPRNSTEIRHGKPRSDERRGGKRWVGRVRFRWSREP